MDPVVFFAVVQKRAGLQTGIISVVVPGRQDSAGE